MRPGARGSLAVVALSCPGLAKVILHKNMLYIPVPAVGLDSGWTMNSSSLRLPCRVDVVGVRVVVRELNTAVAVR